jgi:hypothetical protein
MNRKTRRALQSHQHAMTRDLPEKLTPVPPDEFPPLASVHDQAWLISRCALSLPVSPMLRQVMRWGEEFTVYSSMGMLRVHTPPQALVTFPLDSAWGGELPDE